MQKLLSTFSLVFLFAALSFGQAIDIPISISEIGGGAGTLPLAVGLDPTATTGIDPALGESDLPPFPPGGVYEIRWDLSPFGVGALSTYKDYRLAAAFPFSGAVEHRLVWQLGTGATGIRIAYTLPTGASMLVQDLLTGTIVNSGPLTGTGTYDITFAITAAKVTMTYTNIEPIFVGPGFGITPAEPLNLGSVAFPGGFATLPVTVTNGGTLPLEIAGIVSSNPQFTFAPGTFPVSVAPGANTIFNVTFTPTALGLQTGTLTFTHNAPGSPFGYDVQGTGADANPIFAVNPTSWDFGNTGVGAPKVKDFVVSNNGIGDPLLVTLAATTAPEYTVAPNSANIPAGGSQIFTVTFTPTLGGVVSGSLDFTHNALGSPSSVALTGTGVATFGLVFQAEEQYRLEDSSFTETIQLLSLPAKAQAIQFRLLVNKSAGDNNIVRFFNIQKGLDVADASWILEYEVFRGPLTSNGATLDSVYVLLYNLNQNGGLDPGNYPNLFTVNYSTVDLPALVDTSKTTFSLTETLGSTFEGYPIDITPSRDFINIYVTNRVPSLGDVNGDGSIDILDLIDVVDHIVGRDSLNVDEFARADIAPWVVGNLLPLPDGLVNVMDLAVIQNIILTGYYPNGIAINAPLSMTENINLAKVTNTEAKIVLHITERGIAVRLITEEAIRGAQLEFINVEDDASNMTVDSRLEGGYYLQTGDLLRVLLYDIMGDAVIPPGEHFLANLPFAIENPKSIEIDKVILVNTFKQKIGTVRIEISYGNAPEIPIDYALFQNYPNPFNPTTMVRFAVPNTDMVTLKVYDMLGQEVRSLFSGQVQMGTYTVQWDGLDNFGTQMSSGSYVYRMTASGFVQSKKMVLLK